MAARRTKPKPEAAIDEDNQESPRGSRSFWSGTLTFGLVSIPVSLFSAYRTARSSLRMLANDGTPLARRYFCPKGQEEVSPDQIIRGYELEPDKFVPVSDEELEALEPRKSRDIELSRFVDIDSISAVLFERSYFLAPDGESVRAYHLLSTVMEQSKKAGIASFVMRGKQHLVAITAERGLLRAETLRFLDQLRSPKTIGLPPEPGAKAVHAETVRGFRREIARHSSDELNLDLLKDRSWERMMELVDRKRKHGKDVVVHSAPAPEANADIVDLMAALKQSLGKKRITKRARTAR